MLDLGCVCCWDTDVAAKFLLLVELTCIFRDVAREVPLDMEGGGGLFFLEGRDNTPLDSEVLDDCFDGLAAVANIVVLELFDVRRIDGFTDNFSDDDGIDCFLLPKLLARKVV